MVNRKEIAVVLLIALLLCGTWLLVSRVGTAQSDAQTKFVEDAVREAALTCYAVEGAYPADIDYLVQNYGLAYDESRYLISYEAFASNIFPDIRVNVRGGE